MSSKLNYMKSAPQRLREFVRPAAHLKQPKFEDKLAQHGVEFNHSWKNLAHMHDLRVWTMTYAPNSLNDARRMQEIHLLNNEMWYQVSEALWKRILFFMGFWVLTTRIFKDKFMKKHMVDSHDANFRAVPGHM